MTVNELIQLLSDIEGDLEVYVDITEDVPCGECGIPAHRIHDGFPRSVHVINLDGSKAAHIHSEIDRQEPNDR